MNPSLSAFTRRFGWSSAVLIGVACGGGGGDGGGGPPVTVSSVVITSPAAPPSLASLGATVQFAAQARDAAGAAVSATITWSSSNPAAATVNASGLVTAVANGTTNITATASGVPSTSVAVTVAQVPVAVAVTPATLAFGALGSARQLAAVVNDAGGSPVAGAAAVTWSRSGTSTLVTVSAGGLVTSTTSGTNDTVIGTSGTFTGRVPVTVTQVPHTIIVSSTQVPPDTLFTTTRTRQFSAVARDSNNNNLVTPPTFAWTSSAGAVASVDASTGLVTALTDGTSNIQAAAAPATASRPIVVRRFPTTFTIAPGSANISTNVGTQLFTGTSQDSNGTSLIIAWVSRNTSIATLNTQFGANVTATARGNGSTFIVMTTNSRSDSAAFTASNQVQPISFASQVQPIFNASCTGTCHAGANPTGSLNLTAPGSRNNLVGVSSSGAPGNTRVIAGDSINSYLIRKLKGGPNIIGSQMPENGPPFLSGATITIIARWIQEGALAN